MFCHVRYQNIHYGDEDEEVGVLETAFCEILDNPPEEDIPNENDERRSISSRSMPPTTFLSKLNPFRKK